MPHLRLRPRPARNPSSTPCPPAARLRSGLADAHVLEWSRMWHPQQPRAAKAPRHRPKHSRTISHASPRCRSSSSRERGGSTAPERGSTRSDDRGVASGQSFDQSLRERISDPLGMKNTAFNLDERRRFVSRRVTNERRRPCRNCHLARRACTSRAAADWRASAEDYLRFAQMLLNKGSTMESDCSAHGAWR